MPVAPGMKGGDKVTLLMNIYGVPAVEDRASPISNCVEACS